MLQHPLEEGDGGVAAGWRRLRHAQGITLGGIHPVQAGEAVGVAAGAKHNGLDRRLRIPGTAPEDHRPDLLGLVPPDLPRQGAHTGAGTVEHTLAHPQRTGVVLLHGIEPAKVVGGAGRTNGMTVAWGCNGAARMAVMVMPVGINSCRLRQAGRCQQRKEQEQGKARPPQREIKAHRSMASTAVSWARGKRPAS